MKEILKVEIATICIVHIIAIIIALVFLMMFYMRSNKDYAIKAFLVMQMSIVGWMVFKIFKTVSPTEVSRWWFIVGYYLCACIFEVAFLEFTYAYYKGEPIKKKIRIYLYILPLIQFLLILTNPLHHLFYATYHFRGDSFGNLFYVHSLIEYGFIFVGAYYGYLTFNLRFSDKKLWYKMLISSAIVVPFILNFLYITKKLNPIIRSLGIPIVFDITPIMFVFSTLVFVYATFKHDLINLSPIMRHEIVHKLDTPICVLDSSFEVIYVNEILSKAFKKDSKMVIDDYLENINVKILVNTVREVELEHKYFNMFIKEMNTFKETQYIVTLNNITDYKAVELSIKEEQGELQLANGELGKTIIKLKKTSKIGARNYVARELHDIIGHSLVVTIKLLEVAKLYISRDKKLSTEALSNAIVSIDSGIENMNALSIVKGSNTGGDLERDMRKMLDTISNTEIRTILNFKGVYYKLEDKVYDVIHKICTELTTNTLKHGHAKEIFLSINIRKDDIAILYMDNGVGSPDLVIGNGLRGINERLELVQGKADYITATNEGFMCKIGILMN